MIGVIVLFLVLAALAAAFGFFWRSRAFDRSAPTSVAGWVASIGSSALLGALFFGAGARIGVFDADPLSLAGLAAVLYAAQEAGVLVAARLRNPPRGAAPGGLEPSGERG